MEIPTVDIINKSISGCKEGSFEWYHEKAHLEFAETGLGTQIGFLENITMVCTMLSLVIANFYSKVKYLALAFAIIFLGVYVFEEIWCDYQARIKFKNSK